MISFQAAYTKAQYISGDTTANTLIQFKEDINIGYKRLNAAVARYFTRKQAFTNLVASQQYYQTPVDMVRPVLVAVTISTGYEYPLKQVRSEEEWRQKNIYSSSGEPREYFVYGSDQLGLFPKPSSNVTNGLRLVYQPQDVDLTKADYTTGTVSITNGAVAVTGSGSLWTQAAHGTMWLQVTDGSDGNWYEISSVNSSTSITLKTPYAGPTVSGVTYRLGQLFIMPGEFDDTPVDYALYRFYESKNNPSRARYHDAKFAQMVDKAKQDYASSSSSNVIIGGDESWNAWLIPPQAGA